jgi:MFS family permease
LLARGRLPAVIALRGLIGAAFGTAEVFIPLYLTREAGWSLAEAGLALSAGAVLWSVGSAIQSRVNSQKNRRRGLQVGFIAVALGIAGVAMQLVVAWPAWTTVAAWAVAGLGIGLGLPMLSVLTLSLSGEAQRGNHSSALQLSDALYTSAALAIAGALFAFCGTNGSLGYLVVLTMAAALALVGASLAARAFGADGR